MANDDVILALLGVGLAVVATRSRLTPNDESPTPDPSKVVGSLRWDAPKNGEGVGIRQVGLPSKVTFDISGMTPGTVYRIVNRLKPEGTIIAESPDLIVPESGRLAFKDNTMIPGNYPVGFYDVILRYGGVDIPLLPGFEVQNASTYDMGAASMEPTGNPIDPDNIEDYLFSRGIIV